MVKFNKSITDYRYVLAFDLAKHRTGYALVDIVNNVVVMSGLVDMDNGAEFPWSGIYSQFMDVIHAAKSIAGNNGFFVTKEKLPNQAGRFTTIASLQGLAQVHAIWELCCCHSEVEVYDCEGIHSVSVRAYIAHQTGIGKPTKEDVADYVGKKYGFDGTSTALDVTDAVAVVDTLIGKKWDSDIDAEIKALKKQIKTYKTDKKKNELLTEIYRLKELKIDMEGK